MLLLLHHCAADPYGGRNLVIQSYYIISYRILYYTCNSFPTGPLTYVLVVLGGMEATVDYNYEGNIFARTEKEAKR